MTWLTAYLSGLLFGVGLLLSGMTNPAKVLAFLDLGGAWDPSLAFVMAGAIAMAMPAFYLARLRPKTWLGSPISFPRPIGINRGLAIGSLVFGAGWGLAGFCPGPALVMLLTGSRQVFLFVAAMLVGMSLAKFPLKSLSR